MYLLLFGSWDDPSNPEEWTNYYVYNDDNIRDMCATEVTASSKTGGLYNLLNNDRIWKLPNPSPAVNTLYKKNGGYPILTWEKDNIETPKINITNVKLGAAGWYKSKPTISYKFPYILNFSGNYAAMKIKKGNVEVFNEKHLTLKGSYNAIGSYNVTEDGVYEIETWTEKATDNLQISDKETKTIYVDTTPPTSNITNNKWYNTNVKITLSDATSGIDPDTSSEPITMYEKNVAGQYEEDGVCSNNNVISREGYYYFIGEDVAGNTSSPTYFQIDKTPPTQDAPTVSVSGTTITVDMKQTDALSGIKTKQYNIYKDGAWQGWQTSNTFTGLTNGKSYKVKTKAIDNAENEKESFETGDIVVGSYIPPTITLQGTNYQNSKYYNTDVTVKFDMQYDTDYQLVASIYKPDGNSDDYWSEGKSSITANEVTQEGEYSAEAYISRYRRKKCRSSFI